VRAAHTIVGDTLDVMRPDCKAGAAATTAACGLSSTASLATLSSRAAAGRGVSSLPENASVSVLVTRSLPSATTAGGGNLSLGAADPLGAFDGCDVAACRRSMAAPTNWRRVTLSRM